MDLGKLLDAITLTVRKHWSEYVAVEHRFCSCFYSDKCSHCGQTMEKHFVATQSHDKLMVICLSCNNTLKGKTQ